MREDYNHIKNESVDAVITWVDGGDIEHRKKRIEALKESSSVDQFSVPTGTDSTRFIDNGELRYCIKSIRKFAPWVRNIYLVTDKQVPEFLTKEVQSRYKVTIVDHSEVFKSFEWALPTFSSRTIESVLWRIPNLAPRFIYFNDDFVITKHVQPTDFFRDGKVVLRGSWSSMTRYGWLRLKLNNLVSFAAKKLLGITRSMHLLLQIKSAQLAGFNDRYFRSPHVPHPIHTNTLRRFFCENRSLFEQNIQYQFRNTEQFSAIFLANHLEIKNNSAVLQNADDAMMINGEMDFLPVIKRKLEKISEDKVRFVCLQGLERFKQKHRRHIELTLNGQFE